MSFSESKHKRDGSDMSIVDTKNEAYLGSEPSSGFDTIDSLQSSSSTIEKRWLSNSSNSFLQDQQLISPEATPTLNSLEFQSSGFNPEQQEINRQNYLYSGAEDLYRYPQFSVHPYAVGGQHEDSPGNLPLGSMSISSSPLAGAIEQPSFETTSPTSQYPFPHTMTSQVASPKEEDNMQYSKTYDSLSHDQNYSDQDDERTQVLKQEEHDLETTSYLLARAQALENFTFIGPLTELDAAATAAANASSKTGAGAGAFVYKVYYMLLEPTSLGLIGFSENGKSFIVYNTTLFAQELLPKHFKHSNFSSFVRQLNMYGFHKVNKTSRGIYKNTENLIWEFSHPLFARGESAQLDKIKRKSAESAESITSNMKFTRSSVYALAETSKQMADSESASHVDSLGVSRSQAITFQPPNPPRIPIAGHALSAPAPALRMQQYHHVHNPPYQSNVNVVPAYHSAPAAPLPHSSNPIQESNYTIPADSRVEQLERQNSQLSQSLSDLQRAMDELRRRHDALASVALEQFTTLQRAGIHTPNPFPMQIFFSGAPVASGSATARQPMEQMEQMEQTMVHQSRSLVPFPQDNIHQGHPPPPQQTYWWPPG